MAFHSTIAPLWRCGLSRTVECRGAAPCLSLESFEERHLSRLTGSGADQLAGRLFSLLFLRHGQARAPRPVSLLAGSTFGGWPLIPPWQWEEVSWLASVALPQRSGYNPGGRRPAWLTCPCSQQLPRSYSGPSSKESPSISHQYSSMVYSYQWSRFSPGPLTTQSGLISCPLSPLMSLAQLDLVCGTPAPARCSALWKQGAFFGYATDDNNQGYLGLLQSRVLQP